MSSTTIKIAATAGLFLVIFLCGYGLSRAGKPYNIVVFTAHKLVALGLLVYLVRLVYLAQRAGTLGASQWLAAGLAALCFVATIVLGGLVSIEQPMPLIVRRLHQLTPYLTVLFSSGLIFLLG